MSHLPTTGGNSEVNMNPHEPTKMKNRRTTYIFYKTRMCENFAGGNCPNGDSCTFAHGPKDLREPLPNWQELARDNRSYGIWNDDEKIILKMRICRMFYKGEVCPYGEECTFLHESPDKFKFQPANESGKTRECSVIKVDTGVDRGQCQTVAGQDSAKTHGLSELHNSVGRVEGYVQPYSGSSAAANAVSGPITTKPVATGSASTVPAVPPRIGKGFLKLAGKKLAGIYADWIDEEYDDLD